MALFDVEFDLLAVFQVAMPGTLHSRKGCEDIGRAIMWSDGAVALVGVESFDCAFGRNDRIFNSEQTYIRKLSVPCPVSWHGSMSIPLMKRF